MTSDEHGRQAELTFIRTARGMGAKVEHPPQWNFDFKVNGHRVEFKTARPRQPKRGSPDWQFNLHRHGRLNEQTVDFYILCFEQIPYSQHNFYGAVKAPQYRKTLQFGMPVC